MRQRPKQSSKSDCILSLDQAAACCDKVAAIAKLLVAAAGPATSELLAPETLSCAGEMISAEMIALKSSLESIAKELAKRDHPA